MFPSISLLTNLSNVQSQQRAQWDYSMLFPIRVGWEKYKNEDFPFKSECRHQMNNDRLSNVTLLEF